MSPIDIAPPAIIAPSPRLWTLAKPYIIRASEDDHSAVKAMPFLSAIAGGARRDKPLWTPADLGTTPSAWFDVELSNKTLSGSEVTQWDSIIGSITATQGTSANRPTYDSTDKWLSFDGSNDYLSLSSAVLGTGNASHTIFAVVRPDTTSGNRYFLSQGSAVNHQLPHVGFSGSAYAHNWFGTAYTAGTITSSTWYIVVYRYNGSTRSIYSNGTSIGSNSYSSANNTASSPEIGRLTSNYFLGKMRTLIVCQAALSDTEREKCEGYLAHLWGLAGSLDSGHPYKTYPPYAA